jgi:hypothetical protein
MDCVAQLKATLPNHTIVFTYLSAHPCTASTRTARRRRRKILFYYPAIGCNVAVAIFNPNLLFIQFKLHVAYN